MPDNFYPRHHGWHWWHGISNEKDTEGHLLTVPRWYVVHCWTVNSVAYAEGPHFAEPMRQSEMHGTWGGEIIPPKL